MTSVSIFPFLVSEVTGNEYTGSAEGVSFQRAFVITSTTLRYFSSDIAPISTNSEHLRQISHTFLECHPSISHICKFLSHITTLGSSSIYQVNTKEAHVLFSYSSSRQRYACIVFPCAQMIDSCISNPCCVASIQPCTSSQM